MTLFYMIPIFVSDTLAYQGMHPLINLVFHTVPKSRKKLVETSNYETQSMFC